MVTKEQAWDYALGMGSLSGAEPSPELLDMIEQEKRGEITTEDMIKTFKEKYGVGNKKI